MEQCWPVAATLSDPEVTPKGKHYFDLKPDQWVLLEELVQFSSVQTTLLIPGGNSVKQSTKTIRALTTSSRQEYVRDNNQHNTNKYSLAP